MAPSITASFKSFIANVKFKGTTSKRLKAFKRERRFRTKIKILQAKNTIKRRWLALPSRQRSAQGPSLKQIPAPIVSDKRFRAWVQKKWPEHKLKASIGHEDVERKAQKYIDALEGLDDEEKLRAKVNKIPTNLAQHPLFYKSDYVDQMDKFVLSTKLGSDWDAMMYLLDKDVRFVDNMSEKLWRDKYFMFEAMHRAPKLMFIAYKKLFPDTGTSLTMPSPSNVLYHKIVLNERARTRPKFVFSKVPSLEASILSDLCLCVTGVHESIELLPDEIIPDELFEDKDKRAFEKKMRALEDNSTEMKVLIKEEANAHHQWFDMTDILKRNDEAELERRFKEVEEMDAPNTPWLDFINKYRHTPRMKSIMDSCGYDNILNGL